MTVDIKTIPKVKSEVYAIEIMRREALSDLLRFTQVIFKAVTGREFTIRRHHSIIASALLRVYMGECRRLIINVAPRYGKTELAVKMFIALGLAFNAAARFIH